MSLYTVTTGSTINAADLNQVVNILQQPSGGQESRNYYLFGQSYASNATVSISQSFLSSVSTPVSISVNTSINAPSNCNSPSTAHLSASGCQIWTSTTGGSNTNVGCAGVYTVQY